MFMLYAYIFWLFFFSASFLYLISLSIFPFSLPIPFSMIRPNSLYRIFKFCIVLDFVIIFVFVFSSLIYYHWCFESLGRCVWCGGKCVSLQFLKTLFLSEVLNVYIYIYSLSTRIVQWFLGVFPLQIALSSPYISGVTLILLLYRYIYFVFVSKRICGFSLDASNHIKWFQYMLLAEHQPLFTSGLALTLNHIYLVLFEANLSLYLSLSPSFCFFLFSIESCCHASHF